MIFSYFPHHFSCVDERRFPLVLNGVGRGVENGGAFRSPFCGFLHVRWRNLNALLTWHKEYILGMMGFQNSAQIVGVVTLRRPRQPHVADHLGGDRKLHLSG